MGGLDVTGYHIVNLLIHLANGILVYFLVVLTFKTPYFRSEESVVSSKKKEARNDRQEADVSSLLATHYSPVTRSSSHFIALFSALLFVSHPVQTQAVTYIVQRFTSLAALFYLASVVFYVKGRLASRMAGRLASYLLCLLSAVLAMKVKENSFTLPIMILLYEFSFFKATLKRKLIFLIPILVTLVIIPLSIAAYRQTSGRGAL